jgi:predicted amidohydrolase YtcJ
MAVKDGRILALGKEQEMLNAHRGARVVDVKGATVYPGLIDAHSHLLGYALTLDRLNVVGTTSYEEVVSAVSKARPAASGWIRGRGWDQNDWALRDFPDRAPLDSLHPETPVVLQRIDGHAVLVNRAALVASSMWEVDEVLGGEILRRPDGTPSGVLVDGAADSLLARIPKPGRAEKQRALAKAERNLLACGLTTVTDAGLDWADMLLLDSLHQTGDLNLRVVAMANPTRANLDSMVACGGIRTDRLVAEAFKFYMDGALGSRGAALLEPYDDRPGHRGLLLQDPKVYKEQLAEVLDAGFQAATHAIGDSAARLVLNIYGELLEGANDLRWRMEHAQVIHPDDLPKFGMHAVIPSVQPTHATSDMYWAGERLGRARVRRAYAYQDLHGQLGMLPLGTDFPVEDIDPRKTYLAAVARQDANRTPKEGFHVDQALTPEQSLLGMTLWAALASRMESEVGSLEPGKRADFVVMDRDWLLLDDPHDVLSSKVLQTYMSGELLHSTQTTIRP